MRKAPSSLKQTVKNDLQISKKGGVGKYLDLPEHFERRKKDLFASIVDRIKQKAMGWTTRFMSTSGKEVMLKSVLYAIPGYSMICFKLPMSLCKRIQSAVTRFWWDDRSGKKKMAWISWPKLIRPKKRGGLGFRDFQQFNDAKLSWKIINKPNSLLERTLLGKYCASGNLLECKTRSKISHGWRSVLIGRDLLIDNVGWLVGDGKTIKLWEDPWLNLSTQQRPIGPATTI